MGNRWRWLLLAAMCGAPAAAQQAPARAIQISPMVNMDRVIREPFARQVLVTPEARLAEFLKTCPACQTIATPTGSITITPGNMGAVMQVKGDPFGGGCPAMLATDEKAAMKRRLSALVGSVVVSSLEDMAAKDKCPDAAMAKAFVKIVLGDDVVIARKPS